MKWALLGSLADQMLRAFGTRHDSFAMEIPQGANYMFVKYPPTPFDPYAADQYNGVLPGSGTYRFELASSDWLSVDVVNSMGLPTAGSWRDADQSGGAGFLDYRSFRGRIKSPEYFLPPGIAFQSCMSNGGCPRELLDTIYNQTFPLQVYYYRVDRVPGAALQRVPLKQVGKGFRANAAEVAGMTDTAGMAGTAELAPAAIDQTRPLVYFPLIRKNQAVAPPQPPPPPPPDEPYRLPLRLVWRSGADG